MIVEDIMTKEVITVKKNTSLKEAAGVMAKLRIHGMPVVDESFKILGIITETDFFTKDSSNIFLPTFLDFINKEKQEGKTNEESSEMEKVSIVEDIMTSSCQTVGRDMTIEELIGKFKEENFNSFPVADDQGMLVGIVTIMDVIRLL
jgi:CBS domain-containing protein